MMIYTDGSSSGRLGVGPGGWAFVAYDVAGQLLLEASGGAYRTTNNRMEMRAIIEAMRYADGRKCVICSDSQLCVNTLTTWAMGWEKRGWRKREGEIANLDMVQLAWGLYRASQVEMRWVRGHAGNAGNERADVLAGEARAKFMQAHATVATSTEAEPCAQASS